MTVFERLGVGMVLLILMLDFMGDISRLGPAIWTMALLFVLAGFVLFVARG